MLQILCEIAISIFAVYGGYSLLCNLRRFISEVIEKRQNE